MTRRLPVLLATLLAGACVPEEDDAVTLLVPADVEFSWNAAYDGEDDGLAAFLPLDVMVYDAVSGEAVPGVDVTIGSDGVLFVEAEQVHSGDVDCDACLWDAFRDEWVEIIPAVAAEPLVVSTDASGLARVYAVVDTLDGAEAVDVSVRLGRRVERLALRAR